MLALSINQPYAEAVVRGIKQVEFRTRPTRHRGRVLIHAGKSERHLADTDTVFPGSEPIEMSFGCLIGVVDLVDCRLIRPGEFGYILTNPMAFEPIEFRGMLGFFDVDVRQLAAEFADLAFLA